MNNIDINLQKAAPQNAEEIHKMQVQSFAKLLEKYQDFKTNPGNDTLEKIVSNFQREDIEYYFIKYNNTNVGGIRIKRIEANIMELKTLFVLPEYQGKGIAQLAITKIEQIYTEIKEWRLDTVLQEKGNCYLYEKMGYVKTGRVKNIKEGMDLVYYYKTKG